MKTQLHYCEALQNILIKSPEFKAEFDTTLDLMEKCFNDPTEETVTKLLPILAHRSLEVTNSKIKRTPKTIFKNAISRFLFDLRDMIPPTTNLWNNRVPNHLDIDKDKLLDDLDIGNVFESNNPKYIVAVFKKFRADYEVLAIQREELEAHDVNFILPAIRIDAKDLHRCLKEEYQNDITQRIFGNVADYWNADVPPLESLPESPFRKNVYEHITLSRNAPRLHTLQILAELLLPTTMDSLIENKLHGREQRQKVMKEIMIAQVGKCPDWLKPFFGIGGDYYAFSAATSSHLVKATDVERVRNTVRFYEGLQKIVDKEGNFLGESFRGCELKLLQSAIKVSQQGE